MAVLAGSIVRSPAGGIVSVHLSSAMHQLLVDYWPGHTVAMRRHGGTTLTTHWPVSALPRAISGAVAGRFSDDWYHRIHVRPAVLALGNIVSAQEQEVRVWNSFFVPRTLAAVTGLAEGIDLVPPHGMPYTYGALQEVVWSAEIAREGPSRIDATIAFEFTGVDAPELRITGGRIVEWAFRPDWSNGISERLSWLTDVLTSQAAAEQRRALRLGPRRAFELSFIVEGRDRVLADLALATWGSSTWALPIWPDAQMLAVAVAPGASTIPCTTAGFDWRVGGLAMLIGATPFDVETVEIESIAANHLVLRRPLSAGWPAGTVLAPARTADLVQQPTVVRKTDQLSVVGASFELAEASDWPAVLPATLYRGAPVLSQRPDESEDLSHGWQRLQLALDNGSGLPRRTDTARVGLPVHAHRWMLIGRAEHTAWRSLMYGLAGRLVPVWLPTHADDLVLAATTPADGPQLDVQRCGLVRLVGANPPVGRRDVRIELSDGTALHRRVLGFTAAGELERATIDTSPGVVLRPPGSAGIHVTRISWLQLCRLATDDIELEHVTDADGAARCAVTWRALRDELELAV